MSIETAMDKMADGISARVPVSENEYMGEDGLLHCGICKKNVQTKIKFLGKEKRCVVYAIVSGKSWKRLRKKNDSKRKNEREKAALRKRIWQHGLSKTMTGRMRRSLTQ